MILGITFVLSTIIISSNFNINAENSEKINFYNENLKFSKVSEKIHINSNLGWSDAKTAGICSGEGTYSDPYIIEDLVIDGDGSGSCILIENSDVYFRITKCTVLNSGPSLTDGGIKLYNVYNGQLINNTVTNNILGIFISTSDNNTVVGNTLEGLGIYGATGIKFLHSNNNTIYLNNFANTYTPYGFWYSDNQWTSQTKLTYIYKGNTYTSYLGNHYGAHYTGKDIDNDGIGETALYYDTQGGTIFLPLDEYPLMEPIESYEIISEVSGEVIPGYNIIFLISVISVISLILLEKRKKSLK